MLQYLLEYPGGLHNHTHYSNLRLRDSVITEKQLIDYAIELGHECVGITEHECISSHVKAFKHYQKVKKTNPNFKLILGNEIYLCRDLLTKDNFIKGFDKFYHFCLYAKDAIGHEQIRKLSTRAWDRSWLVGKTRRIPTYYNDLFEIIATNPGHVVASTACLGGALGAQLLIYRETNDLDLLSRIESWCQQLQNVFGEDNFFLEMQPSNNQEQIYVNQQILQMSKKLNIPYIITTDSHYLNKEDKKFHKAYLKSQDGDREVDSFYSSTYMMSSEEMYQYLHPYLSDEEINYGYENIIKIKDMCTDYDLLKDLYIPRLKWKDEELNQNAKKYIDKISSADKFINSDYEGDNLLINIVLNKITTDYSLQSREGLDAIEDCLDKIWVSSIKNKTHWSAYLLNLQNIIDLCWEANSLVGPGRGSGVGFILLYILGITQINPILETTKTESWRFLNPDRVSVLDVDFDIESGKREDVLSAFRKAYGADRIANVATFGTETAKAAILTAARGLEIDSDISSYLASLVPSDRGKTRTLSECYYGDVEKEFNPIAQFVKTMDEYPDLWSLAQRIEGLICRYGVHAGGVIFVDHPFTDNTALMKSPKGVISTQYDLHDSEDVGLIKYDVLSINALDKIHTCLDFICDYGYEERESTLRETYEKIIGVYNLERNDEKMWELIWEHKIESLFQMEQQSGTQGIALTKPKSVDDLAVLNSVIRLMAQEKGMEQPLNKYARFKDDLQCWYNEMEYYGLTEEEMRILEPIVKISYGICESQEKSRIGL